MMLKNNFLLLFGIVATMLIHVTWKWGLDYLTLDILANNIGRCGLFIFVLEMGRMCRESKDKLFLLKKISIIYLLCFVTYNTVLILTKESSIISYFRIFGKFILGVDGNIWIIHGLLVFLAIVFFCDRITYQSRIKLLFIGAGYSTLALTVFVYANVYKNIWMFDNNIIFKLFKNILGSNRPSVVLAVPFLYLGYISKNIKINRTLLKYVCIITNIVWIAEITLLQQLYSMNNVYMTIIGAIGILSLYLLIKTDDYNYPEFEIALIIFGLQYTIHTFVIWAFDLSFVGEYLLWFCVYTAVIVPIYYFVSMIIKRQIDHN